MNNTIQTTDMEMETPPTSPGLDVIQYSCIA